ncbi:LysE family transporter [Fusobacterium sp. PH5-44]|uniref:LysE family transporter n=1 Tax=unclassified Fusobacterium TaxID=2648384 RepID=UPI003D2024D3
MHLFFIKGIITGFILSLPFGPVGVYCMEKTLTEGHKKGYTAAMGMVTVDLIYNNAVMLFMEIDPVDNFISKYQLYFKAAVAIFLLFIGIKKIMCKKKMKQIELEPEGYIKSYFTVFFLALSNLSSFFVIGTIYTYLHMLKDFSNRAIPCVLLGVLTGGGSLWFLTTYILAHWRKTINECTLKKIIKGTGVVITIFAVISLTKILHHIVIKNNMLRL